MLQNKLSKDVMNRKAHRNSIELAARRLDAFKFMTAMIMVLSIAAVGSCDHSGTRSAAQTNCLTVYCSKELSVQ